MVSYRFWNASDFWIGDLPLNYIDDNGCKWMIHDVDGWWELPPPSIPDDSRPYSDDGDYSVAGRYAPRVITVKGRITPPPDGNSSVVTDARDRLNRMLNSVRKPLYFRVDEPRYPKQARVQIDNKPTVEINTHKNHVEFSIQFKASDPRKYYAILQNVATMLPGSTTVGRKYPRDMYYTYGENSVDGTIYAENHGDYHTFGTIRISGPITNPRLVHRETKKAMQFNIVLGVDEFLDVNLRARTVKLNGKQFKRSAMTTNSTWFSLQPGQNSIQFFGTQHIAAREGKVAAVNEAINPSFEYSEKANSKNIEVGASTSFINRKTVDPTSGTGRTIRVRPNTSSDTDNVSFIIPSAGEDSEAPYTLAVGSQGIYPGYTYTASVEAIITEKFQGTYSEEVTYNLASAPYPASNLDDSWRTVGFKDTLKKKSNDIDPDGVLGIDITNLETKIYGSGVTYRQPKGQIPDSAPIYASLTLRTNRLVPFQPVMRWYSSSGNLVRESWGETVTPQSAGDWFSVSVDATAPPNYSSVELSATVVDIPETIVWEPRDYLEVRNVYIATESSGVEPFNGNTPDSELISYEWTGTAGSSTSKRIEKVGGEDSLHDLSRSLAFIAMKDGNQITTDIDPESFVYDQAPNEPGKYTLRIKFTTPDVDSQVNSMFLALWNGSPNNSDTIYFDNLLIVEGDYDGNYFDGSSPDARWDGSASTSKSIQSEVTEIPSAQALIQFRSAWIH